MTARSGMAARSEDERISEMLRKLLDEMEPLPGRISNLIQQHRGRSVVTAAADDPKLRSLDFIRYELGGVVASLRQPGPDYVHDDDFYKWLNILSRVATAISSYLEKAEQASLCGCHTQLHRTAAYCCLRAAGLPLPFPQGVEAIEKKLCEVAERACRYRHLLLDDGGVPITSLEKNSSSAELHNYAVHSGGSGINHLVGIENARRNKLVRWFMDDDDQTLKVISFVGPAGVGKTTLAIEIYRQLHNGRHCTTAAVNVSQRPDANKGQRLLRDLLSQIQLPQCTSAEDATKLAERIKQYLQDKRYLILIDDIWEESDWDVIKNALPYNNEGSRILVTTSVTRVAEACFLITDARRIGNVLKVNPLSQADSEKLLLRKAFDSEGSCPDRLKHACEEILMRCGGIPLFICGMADWMNQQQQEQSVPHLPQMLQIFEQSLSAAYDDLPYSLKVQFLYVSMFPHGYMFEKNSFSKRLGTECLIDSGKTDEYFDELVNRNVITPAANCKLSPKEDCLWQVNYFMHQFLAIKSAEKGFLWTSASVITSSAAGRGKRPRRLSLHLTDSESPDRLAEMDLYHTRSLAVSGTMGEIRLDKFTCMMVLDLEGWLCFKDEYLLIICKMFLLRYLSLKKTCAKKLPPNIRELFKLETLDLSHTHITELPWQVCELAELRMMDLRGTPVKKLPAQIRKMRQLRDLFFGVSGVDLCGSVTEVPEEIRYLDVLRTLETLDLSQCSAAFVATLGGMEQLKVLAITWSLHQSAEEKFQSALLSSIGKWKDLESLTIHCQLGCSMDFLHFRSDQKHPVHLEKFRVIGGRFRQMPKWFAGLNHLAFIEITVCTLLKDDLRMLSNLPSLECLVLSLHLLPEEAIVIDGRGGFPVLQRLYVSCRVPWVIFEKEAMPMLTYLELNIGGSPAKKGRVPSGISNLRSLSEVNLHYNKFYHDSPNVTDTIETVKAGVAEHQRTINLLVNGKIQCQQEEGLHC